MDEILEKNIRQRNAGAISVHGLSIRWEARSQVEMLLSCPASSHSVIRKVQLLINYKPAIPEGVVYVIEMLPLLLFSEFAAHT